MIRRSRWWSALAWAPLCFTLVVFVTSCQQRDDTTGGADAANQGAGEQQTAESGAEDALPPRRDLSGFGTEVTTAPADTATDSTGQAAGSGLKVATDEIHGTSFEGKFEVIWPPGCGKIRNRTKAANPDAPIEEQVVETAILFCDRAGYKEEGCQVSAHLNRTGPDGGPPTPDLVIAMANEILDSFQVNVVEQRPLRLNMIEGVEVRAVDFDEVGEVWMRALLVGSRIYVLTAWKRNGQLFNDPAYYRFFESFRTLPED